MHIVVLCAQNDFMWELEESKDFPLETLDCEDQVRSK